MWMTCGNNRFQKPRCIGPTGSIDLTATGAFLNQKDRLAAASPKSDHVIVRAAVSRLRSIGYCAMRPRKSLKNISPAHNADDFSVIDDRNALDPVLIEQGYQFAERHFWVRGDHWLGHYIGGFNVMRLQEIASLKVNQIGFTYNPAKYSILIQYRDCTDPVG